MFDDPKKELQRLQDKLLAAEEPEWEPPEVDADTALAEVQQMLAKDANRDADEDDRDAVPEDENEDIPQKKSRLPGLLLALVLETLVLVLLAAWWILCR